MKKLLILFSLVLFMSCYSNTPTSQRPESEKSEDVVEKKDIPTHLMIDLSKVESMKIGLESIKEDDRIKIVNILSEAIYDNELNDGRMMMKMSAHDYLINLRYKGLTPDQSFSLMIWKPLLIRFDKSWYTLNNEEKQKELYSILDKYSSIK